MFGGTSQVAVHAGRRHVPSRALTRVPQRDPLSQTREDQELGPGRVSEGPSCPRAARAGQRDRPHKVLFWLSPCVNKAVCQSAADCVWYKGEEPFSVFYYGTIYIQENVLFLVYSSERLDKCMQSCTRCRKREMARSITLPIPLCHFVVSPPPAPQPAGALSGPVDSANSIAHPRLTPEPFHCREVFRQAQASGCLAVPQLKDRGPFPPFA